MKTLIQIIKAVTFFMSFSFVVGCGNQNKSNNNVNAIGSYVYQNGQCTYRQTGQVVDPSLCLNNGLGNTGYQYTSNGQCLSTQTGQLVDPTYCQNAGNLGYGQQIQCNGVYWYYNGYQWQQLNCTGQICSGLTVYPIGAQSQAQAVRCF